MNVYEMFETDPNLENGDGITLDYGEFKIKIHRAGGANTKFIKALEAMRRKHRRQLEIGSLPDEVVAKINAELYADTVIIGWAGVTDRIGKELPFNRENVVKVLLDMPKLFQNIRDAASDYEFFLVKQKDEDLGKSGPVSGGN